MLRSRRRRNRIAFAVALAFGIVLTILSAEFCARVYLAKQEAEQSPKLDPERAAMKSHLTEWGYFVFDDYKGERYGAIDGGRRVLGQPSAYTRTLYLFGNSGTEDEYVPDAQTMATDLQTMLNASGYRWRVVNLASDGMLVSAEYSQLQQTDVHAGDLVAFIDGSMDIRAGLTNCNMGNSTYASIALIDLACDSLNNLPPTHLDTTISRYWRTVDASRRYAIAHSLTFYHFAQPYVSADYMLPLGGTSFDVSADGFVESSHLNAHGDALVAAAVFDALTLI